MGQFGNTLAILRPPNRSTPAIQTVWNEDLVKNMHDVLGRMAQQFAAQIIPAGIIRYTALATTSGTAHGFTSIPAGTNRITFMLDKVSLDGSDELLIQIGDTDGYETTSYSASSSRGALSPNVSTLGFIINSGAIQAETFSGSIFLYRINDNIWLSSANLRNSGNNFIQVSAGIKTLSAELDRIRIVPTLSDSFDGGNVNITTEV